MFSSRDHLSNAATHNDSKPDFLRKFADWIAEWRDSRIKNCEKFQLSKQTSDAMILTLKCHAALIEDLLSSPKYNYVLTARFQSDPIERRFSRYRQMSGGRFLVSWKDVNQSEAILKMKTLLKAGCDIDESLSNVSDETKKEALMAIDQKNSDVQEEQYSLSSSSREVSNMVAGYVARKTSPLIVNCCASKLVGECTDDKYVKLISRGGLLVPSQKLSDTVVTSFAVLQDFEGDIRNCSLNAREAAEYILVKCLKKSEVSCENHEDIVFRKMIRIIVNVYLNNKTKRKAEGLLEDKVRAFKKAKLEKRLR